MISVCQYVNQFQCKPKNDVSLWPLKIKSMTLKVWRVFRLRRQYIGISLDWSIRAPETRLIIGESKKKRNLVMRCHCMQWQHARHIEKVKKKKKKRKLTDSQCVGFRRKKYQTWIYSRESAAAISKRLLLHCFSFCIVWRILFLSFFFCLNSFWWHLHLHWSVLHTKWTNA